jgi:hypothetical protein
MIVQALLSLPGSHGSSAAAATCVGGGRTLVGVGCV